MEIKVLSLTLQCRRRPVVIDFNDHITFFHGPTSVGKSSIGKFISFCFGGDYVPGHAFEQELVSVMLTARINNNEVYFERAARRSRQVQVTWRTPSDEIISVLAPIDPETTPIIENSVYNLSDLLFFLVGSEPIMVKRSKFDEGSPLIRLSFRDIFWYCHLVQTDLDSSFFNLEHPFKRLKSRDVMRFFVGLYSDKLNELEIELEEVRKQRIGRLEAAKQVREFLRQFGYSSANLISEEVTILQQELDESKSSLTSSRQSYLSETHFADELRSQLKELSRQISNEETSSQDLLDKITDQESLKAELISTKVKLTRVDIASPVLSKVTFELCPCCGTSVNSPSYPEEGRCKLCGRYPTFHEDEASTNIQARNNLTISDINLRIFELDRSISKHQEALLNQENLIAQYKSEKAILDRRMSEELTQYDSAYLSQTREIERHIATLEEKIRNLEKISQLPEAISNLEREIADLSDKEDELIEEIKREKNSLTEVDRRISKIENYFLEALIETDIPYINQDDRVEINRTTWIPSVLKSESLEEKQDFYSVSDGIRPLWNIDYALAVHRVSEEFHLPLPTLLIIDSPMKNIGNRLDREIVINFYKYLYQLSRGPLANTQFLIMDQEFIEPDDQNLDLSERLMTRDDPSYPPLIPYYQEP